MSKNENEEGKNIIKVNLIKVSYFLFLAYISFLFFAKLLIECKQRKTQSNNSRIHLKIMGPGNNINILSSSYDNMPNEILSKI